MKKIHPKGPQPRNHVFEAILVVKNKNNVQKAGNDPNKKKLSERKWVRNRAGENRPGDIRPNHFVYTCVGTRVSTHMSTRVGAFVWDYTVRPAKIA